MVIIFKEQRNHKRDKDLEFTNFSSEIILNDNRKFPEPEEDFSDMPNLISDYTTEFKLSIELKKINLGKPFTVMLPINFFNHLRFEKEKQDKIEQEKEKNKNGRIISRKSKNHSRI